jgi:hypothetical protein
VQQHLGRQDGVEKVEVSLVDGKVVILPKEDAKFDPVAIFKAVYDSGVSVSEMTITANGEVAGTTFRIGQNWSFQIKPNALSKSLDGAVKVRGLVYKKPTGTRPKVPDTSQIEILEILK